MEIPSQVLVKTLWILTNTSPNSYLFENVSVSFHIKKNSHFPKAGNNKENSVFFCFFVFLVNLGIIFKTHFGESP